MANASENVSIIFAQTSTGYPWLKPTDVIGALNRWRRLDCILPDADLEKSKAALGIYWSRFKALYPEHEIFEKLSVEQLKLTVPIRLHGDEGRSSSAEK